MYEQTLTQYNITVVIYRKTFYTWIYVYISLSSVELILGRFWDLTCLWERFLVSLILIVEDHRKKTQNSPHVPQDTIGAISYCIINQIEKKM